MPTSDPYAIPPQATGPGVRNVATVQTNDGTNNVDEQICVIGDPNTWAAQTAVKGAPPTESEYGLVTRSIEAPCNQAVVTAQVSIAASDFQITAASPNQYRRRVRIKPVGNLIYVGPTGVTALNGFLINDGEEVELPLGPSVALYGIGPSASGTVYVMELA